MFKGKVLTKKGLAQLVPGNRFPRQGPGTTGSLTVSHGWRRKPVSKTGFQNGQHLVLAGFLSYKIHSDIFVFV